MSPARGGTGATSFLWLHWHESPARGGTGATSFLWLQWHLPADVSSGVVGVC